MSKGGHNVSFTTTTLHDRSTREGSMAVIHYVAKLLGVYRPAVPCRLEVARILEFTDALAADPASIPISHS